MEFINFVLKARTLSARSHVVFRLLGESHRTLPTATGEHPEETEQSLRQSFAREQTWAVTWSRKIRPLQLLYLQTHATILIPHYTYVHNNQYIVTAVNMIRSVHLDAECFTRLKALTSNFVNMTIENTLNGIRIKTRIG